MPEKHVVAPLPLKDCFKFHARFFPPFIKYNFSLVVRINSTQSCATKSRLMDHEIAPVVLLQIGHKLRSRLCIVLFMNLLSRMSEENKTEGDVSVAFLSKR